MAGDYEKANFGNPETGASPLLTPTGEVFSPLKGWIAVCILLIFSLFSILDRQVIALLVEPMKADLQLTDTELGLLQGLAFAIFYSLAGIPIGWAVDKFPRKIILYLGITFWSLSAAACGLASNFWQLFAGRTSVGVGEATMTPAAVSLISDLFPPHKVSTPFGVYSAGFYVGSGVALGIGGWIISLFAGAATVHFPIIGDVASWQAVFLVTGLPGVLVAFLAFAIHDPASAKADFGKASGKPHGNLFAFIKLRRRIILHSFCGFSMATFTSYVIGAWTPAFMSREFGMAPAQIGWTFGLVIALAGAVGSFGGGIVLDRLYRNGLKDAYFVVPGFAALVGVFFLSGAYFMPSPTAVLVMLGIGMTILGCTAPASYSTWRKISIPSVRGQVSAAAVLCMGLFGAGFGPLSVALVTDYVVRDEARIGLSLSIVLAVVVPTMSLLFLTGRSAMRALPD
jgi:MFS family permease